MKCVSAVLRRVKPLLCGGQVCLLRFSSNVHSSTKMILLLLTVSCLLSLATSANPRPYPPADRHLQTTNILDHEKYLADLDDHQWYLDNIPFIDVPDKSMQEIYYYRASVIKRHLRWAHEGHGWVVTEFIRTSIEYNPNLRHWKTKLCRSLIYMGCTLTQTQTL